MSSNKDRNPPTPSHRMCMSATPHPRREKRARIATPLEACSFVRSFVRPSRYFVGDAAAGASSHLKEPTLHLHHFISPAVLARPARPTPAGHAPSEPEPLHDAKHPPRPNSRCLADDSSHERTTDRGTTLLSASETHSSPAAAAGRNTFEDARLTLGSSPPRSRASRRLLRRRLSPVNAAQEAPLPP